MSSEMHFCAICGSSHAVEDHHIMFKSQIKPLEKCPYNHIYLCPKHHRDPKEGVHFNVELDEKLKAAFKLQLEKLFTKDTYTLREIRDILKIGNNAVNKLCKNMWTYEGRYKRDDIIRVCTSKYIE
ncbi:MAG: hypothetical protein ABF633_20495 [Clostridium sp.]|uniref:hypothetical protein n=1 Tax=Clostridium sp. TaxID=1506 RepID=UPI0039E98C56